MRKLLSLVLVATMLLSMVAAIPMNASAAGETKVSTEAEAYYFGGTLMFNELAGTGSTKNPYTYYGEELIKEGDASKGTLTIDGVIDEGEWGNPSFVVSSDYAANNGGFTSKANGVFEEPSAENSYFYYDKNSYKYANQYVKTPIEEGMSYTVYLMWDEEFLYVAADVYDITGHMNSATNNTIWNGDAFQFRVDKDGSYTRADGYNADGGKDEDGNHVTIQPWKSSVYRGGVEFTSEVPNFVVCYTSGNDGTTLIRDNSNRYYPHEVQVDDPDSDVETDTIPETQYCDIDISYAVTFEDVCETYDDYLASNFGGQSTAVAEWGPAYAVAYPQKQSGTKFITQYEIAVPWAYIDDAEDFLAEAGDEFGFATMLLDRQNSLATSFGSFLEWGNGVNNHRAYHDHLTCNGSNSLVLSATDYNARADYHEHTFAEADCTKPETCTVCGYQRGFKTGHDYELTGYRLPTESETGYANAVCTNCGDTVEQTLAAASSEVYKWFDRNDTWANLGGEVDLASRLSSAFTTGWTQIEWTYATAEGATEPSWTPKAGAPVYNVDGDNAGTAKNMLWLKGQTRPEVVSNEQVEVSGIVNPYDFAVLDLTCMSETGTYFHLYDFKGKNSAVSVDVNIWHRLSQLEKEMEGETGYHDTMVFWFGPTLIEYAAGLFIVEDRDENDVVTDTKYFFAIGPSGMNGTGLTIEAFKETALAYKEVDPSVIGIGKDEWHNMTFYMNYDANVALLFWDGELAVGEYDYHFARTDSTADPIFRVFNLEMCLTDLYAGEAGLAYKHANISGDLTPDTDPIETDPIETDPVEPVLGSYENPYLLNIGDVRVPVTVAPGETAYVKATDANNSVVALGATGAYTIWYLRQPITGAGDSFEATFQMVADVDTFSITNDSETETLVAYFNLEAGEAPDNKGTMDNPEELVLQDMFGRVMGYAEFELAAGNQGRYYKVVAPADGTFYITPGAYTMDADGVMVDLGWMYFVNNITSSAYGDNHWSDDAEPVYSEEVEVKAGDELVIMVSTFDPADAWNNPAGTITVNAMFAKTPKIGEMDNPEIIEIGDHVAEIVEGSQGYYYEWTATEKGTVTITMNDASGWMYNVNNLTSYAYGETHWYNDDPVVSSESIDVEAGDVIKVMVNKYDPADEWNAPAGTINWNLSFEKYVAPSVNYTISGEIVDDQLVISVDLSNNEAGLAVAILDLLYNTDAIKFVSADYADSAFENADVFLAEDGKLRVYGEAGGENEVGNMYENGTVFTAVFEILDPDANFNFDLVVKDNDPANHTSVDENENPVDVEFTFAADENMPENGNDFDPILKSIWMDVVGEMIDGQYHVYINIANTNNAPFWSFGFDLDYNEAVLALNSYNVSGDVFAAEELLVNDANGAIHVFGSNDELENIAAAGTMVELVFDVVGGGTADFEVTYDAGNVIDVNGKEVALVVNVAETPEFEAPAPEYDGWEWIDGYWYFYENGAPICNTWRKDSNGWCWLGETGAMATNTWVQDSKGWCYVGADGYCVTNCFKLDSVGWCYLDSEGSQVKENWVFHGGKWYYINAEGYMISSVWQQDSTGWVYLGEDGAMVTNTWVRDSLGWCYVGADGYAVTNCFKKDSYGWCYLGETGSQVYNTWVEDGGKWYYIGADGYMISNAWRQDSQGWCYLDASGYWDGTYRN